MIQWMPLIQPSIDNVGNSFVCLAFFFKEGRDVHERSTRQMICIPKGGEKGDVGTQYWAPIGGLIFVHIEDLIVHNK